MEMTDCDAAGPLPAIVMPAGACNECCGHGELRCLCRMALPTDTRSFSNSLSGMLRWH